MKNLFFYSVLAAVVFSSCAKDEESNNYQPPESSKIKYDLNNVEIEGNRLGFSKSGQSITQLLDNPNDQDDEKINYHLYHLSIATRD